MLNIFFLIHFKMVRSDVVCMCVGGGGGRAVQQITESIVQCVNVCELIDYDHKFYTLHLPSTLGTFVTGEFLLK